MDQAREDREMILTLQTEREQLRYLISLVDLLSRRSSGVSLHTTTSVRRQSRRPADTTQQRR